VPRSTIPCVHKPLGNGGDFLRTGHDYQDLDIPKHIAQIGAWNRGNRYDYDGSALPSTMESKKLTCFACGEHGHDASRCNKTIMGSGSDYWDLAKQPRVDMPFATLADHLLSTTTAPDPAGAYVECTIVEVPATSSIAAHNAIKSKCTLCGAFKTWSSWTRIRAHLSGDGAMALGAGTTKCMNVPSAVAERLKAMITVAHADARSRSAIRRAGAAAYTAAATATQPVIHEAQCVPGKPSA
jgi:hypothetical protein